MWWEGGREDREPQVGGLCLSSHPEQETRRKRARGAGDSDRESGLKACRRVRDVELSTMTLMG